MERGTELEPVARLEYEMETGNEVTQVGFVSKDDYSGLSPDGLVGEVGAIEIIVPNTGNHIHSIRTDSIAPAKRWQIAHYFFCMPIEWLDFVSFDDRIERRLFIKRILREDVQDDIDRIGEVVEKAIEEIKSF